jgi:uncharacterized protein (DUF433 family)
VTAEPREDAWIVSRPEVLGGKPCIRGTRISVQFILELMASGATQEQILAQYPQVPAEGLAAALRYAAEAMNDVVWDVKLPA